VILFVWPVVLSVVSAFTNKSGHVTLANFATAFGLYGLDIAFTAAMVTGSVAITAVIAVALAGYLVLARRGPAVRLLAALYRVPLFIPFIVIGQMMRSFLAKNGLLNNGLEAARLLDPLSAASFLDWRGILISFVWKQVPFVTLMVAGALAALEASQIEAARNMGAGRPRLLFDIALPQIRAPLTVACVLTFVTLISVLSVPAMLSADSPTMITVDMAYRITTFGDYGIANALGVVSYAMTAVAGWFYLRHAPR
jgi:ABC-type spermidine/putrescine transport system permease subunit I